jgi:pimeloyl-ACP methyl ester carboxylesterase
MRHLPLSKRYGRWALAASAVAATVVPAVVATSGASSAAPRVANVASSADPTAASLIQKLDSVPTQQRPTVVFVHGAWAETGSWSGEMQTLAAAGYNVRSIGNPVENLTTDSETVHDFLKTISGPIVLVGHSYGGSVITNAATGVPNVKALVYIDAFEPAPGETSASLNGSTSVFHQMTPDQLFTAVPYANAPAGASDLYLNKDVFINDFANDLPVAQAQSLWAGQRGASTVAFNTPSQTAAWKTIPSWTFIATGDKIITESSKLAMASRAHSHVTEFQGGSHLTLISHPEAVTATIASAITSVS